MDKDISENKAIKIPFIWRMRAWWHGYDMDDVRARLSPCHDKPPENIQDNIPAPENGENENAEDDEPANGADAARNDSDVTENHIAVKAVWDNDRAHVAQVFWGDGFCGPGGPENIIAMTSPLNINSKRTIMVVGAGLGGPVRAMQKEYDTPVHGYESSGELASRGKNMSEEAGVSEDAPISHLDLENINDFPQKYDRAYAKESLFIINNKTQLIQTIFDHLREDGLFLLTDYILSENADLESRLYKKWCELEPYAPKPATSAEMQSSLEQAGFTLRENEDISNFYLDLIAKTRLHAKKIIAGMENEEIKDVTILKYMHNEAVFWDTRAKLLQTGDLRVMKYLCHRPT